MTCLARDELEEVGDVEPEVADDAARLLVFEALTFVVESLLLEQCVVFREGLLANAEFLEGAMQYGQQMEAAGDLEEVVQFVEYLGAKLELDVETMSIPGCSFAPSSQ